MFSGKKMVGGKNKSALLRRKRSEQQSTCPPVYSSTVNRIVSGRTDHVSIHALKQIVLSAMLRVNMAMTAV